MTRSESADNRAVFVGLVVLHVHQDDNDGEADYSRTLLQSLKETVILYF